MSVTISDKKESKKKESKPIPADYADIAVDFSVRYFNKDLHLLGSGWGSQAHLYALTTALYESSLKFSDSVMSLIAKCDKETGYRMMSRPDQDIADIRKDIDVLVPWDDCAESGVSVMSTLINVLYNKDEIGFKEVVTGVTKDNVGVANYQLILGTDRYYGPRHFLEHIFPYVRSMGKTIEEQRLEEEARKKTVADLRDRGFLDAISTYKYPFPILEMDLPEEEDEEEGKKFSLFERYRRYKLKKEAVKLAREYLEKGENNGNESKH